MTDARFTVTDPSAPRRACSGMIRQVAENVAADARSRTPVESGDLKAGWKVEPGRAEGVWLVLNDVPYARFVEYGTRNDPAHPMLGPAAARYRH